MPDLPFILQKSEKVAKDVGSIYYSGTGYVTVGGVIGTSQSNIGTSIFSGQQYKREGSIWDSKPAHIYITNKKIVFCNAKIGFLDRKEKSVGTPFSEIDYKNVKAINKSSKLGNPAIDLSIAGQGSNIDNIKFWFLGTEQERGKERDNIFSLIKKKLK